MNWKKEFEKYEEYFLNYTSFNIMEAIEFTKRIIKDNPNDMEVYIRGIYLIHHILLEEHYTEDEADIMYPLLKEYFEYSFNIYSDNATYLFFIGTITHIAEYFFGLNDTRLSYEMQKKAFQLEPTNILFEWNYRSSLNGDSIHCYLAYQIVKYDVVKINWLKSNGIPGLYILGHLQNDAKRYEEQNVTK